METQNIYTFFKKNTSGKQQSGDMKKGTLSRVTSFQTHWLQGTEL